MKEKRLPLLLRKSWFNLNQAFRRRLSTLSLTPNHFTVLRWLHEHPDGSLTQRDLVHLMASDANTIASLSRRMEESGWIRRRPHPKDRRAIQIFLSAKGKKVFQKAHPIAAELQDGVLSALPARDQKSFLRMLSVIAEASEEELQRSP